MKIEVGDRILVSTSGEIYVFRDDKIRGTVITDKRGFVTSWGYSDPVADVPEKEEEVAASDPLLWSNRDSRMGAPE